MSVWNNLKREWKALSLYKKMRFVFFIGIVIFWAIFLCHFVVNLYFPLLQEYLKALSKLQDIGLPQELKDYLGLEATSILATFISLFLLGLFAFFLYVAGIDSEIDYKKKVKELEQRIKALEGEK
jgi:hypothetical protein